MIRALPVEVDLFFRVVRSVFNEEMWKVLLVWTWCVGVAAQEVEMLLEEILQTGIRESTYPSVVGERLLLTVYPPLLLISE